MSVILQGLVISCSFGDHKVAFLKNVRELGCGSPWYEEPFHPENIVNELIHRKEEGILSCGILEKRILLHNQIYACPHLLECGDEKRIESYLSRVIRKVQDASCPLCRSENITDEGRQWFLPL